MFGVTYWTVEAAQKKALNDDVTTDLAGLVDIHATGGRKELVARIDDRLALTESGSRRSHYLLLDERGDRIAGDIDQWPDLSARLSEGGFVTLAGDTPVYARVTALAPDLRLAVAREYGDERDMLRRLALAFAGAGAAILLLVGAATRFIMVRLARRIDLINRAYRAPFEGDARIAFTPEKDGDEIDELAAHSAQALNRLADLAQTQRHMTDNVAHEIRTPLMHLDGRLMAIGDGKLGSVPQDDIQHARSEIREITSLLDSLLDIASNEARRGDPAGLAPVDFSALCQRLVDLYESSMEEAGLTLEARITPGVDMLAEEMQISRILTNLLDNAIKYVPAGGDVSLTLDPGPRLVIQDNGPGIAEDARPHIFSRFTRGRSAVQQAGHGLGLALARAIAERHGLTLRLADSERGARFVLEPEK